MFGQLLEEKIDEVLDLRRQIRHAVIRDIRDVKLQQSLLQTAQKKMGAIELIADVLLLSKISKTKSLDVFFDKKIKKTKLKLPTPEQTLADVFPDAMELNCHYQKTRTPAK